MVKQHQQLVEQNYQDEEPQTYKVMYYREAKRAARSVLFATDRDKAIRLAFRAIVKINDDTRRRNNRAAFEAFLDLETPLQTGTQASVNRLRKTVFEVEIRLDFDAVVMLENGETHYHFFHCGADPLDSDTARRALELAQWILEEHGIDVPMRDFRYSNFRENTVHRFTGKRRVRTVKNALKHLELLPAMWDAS